ncbi:uncharacterized protein LOC115332464 [Ixodes scapularis]|uniref:uncharacterized protein LOC120845780 n=1 Tax=Ixodes scapularis TaxID=6945 RepID=UPI001A9E5B1F|nr:uncharacterized protein LOC120845780 [Ixodes scapularis]XP_040076102.1 uncharacterized protein LOC115332464 [Ixodes scapularis]
MDSTRRRRLLYMEKGAPFKLPRTTLFRTKKEAAAKSSHDPTAANSHDVPSDGEELDSDFDVPATVAAEEPVSPESEEEETVESRTETPPISEETTERPPLVDEGDLIAASLRAFGAETLPHSTTTKAAAVAMIMAFVASEGLTWKGLDNLLVMINFFFAPEPAVLPPSKYLFRKLWGSETESAVVRHYYCRACNDLLDIAEEAGICPTCEKTTSLNDAKKDGAFFVVLDIHKQLNHVVQRSKPALHTKLTQVARDPGTASTITDITDGQAYAKLKASGTVQGSDLTLTVSTDGSPVFTSSGASVWPIQFTVNELPVPERFRLSTLAGLWFGKGHPNMTLFLGKFVEGVNAMEPVLWQHQATRHSSKAFVLCFCLDAPARSSVQNIVLFNGYFGCPWCHIKGDYVDGSLRFLSFEDVPGRTSEGVRRDMDLALETSMTINGYKGPSPAVNLPHFDLVWGFTVEYMHGVLLGVTRQITELLLSSTNSNERFYIGSPSSVAALDRRLLLIKPPHCFTRLPRSLGTRVNWKASEWRHWLLFYCLPCTQGILPLRYWSHLAKLVEAIHLLLREELTPSSIDQAETLLLAFVASTRILYKDLAMTFNVHQLLHLAEAARQMGPLWGHSAFVFESGNGHLVKLVTGANAVPSQIVERVVMEQHLECLLTSPLLSDSCKEMCNRMLGYPKLLNFMSVGEVGLLGCPHKLVLSEQLKSALSEYVDECPDLAAEYTRCTNCMQLALVNQMHLILMHNMIEVLHF